MGEKYSDKLYHFSGNELTALLIHSRMEIPPAESVRPNGRYGVFVDFEGLETISDFDERVKDAGVELIYRTQEASGT